MCREVNEELEKHRLEKARFDAQEDLKDAIFEQLEKSQDAWIDPFTEAFEAIGGSENVSTCRN